jgi:hypothetical protein
VLGVNHGGTLSAEVTNNGTMTMNGGTATMPVDNQATINVTGANPSTFAAGGGTVDNAGTINVQSPASVAFNSGVAGPGTINVAAGASATALVFGSGTLNVAGTMTAAPGWPSANVAGSLSITGAGRLDLKDNKLIVFVGDAGTASEGIYNGLQGQVQSAWNFGTWDGPGLTTSMPEALGGVTTLGVATGEQVRGLGPTDTDVWAGVTINGASVIAMYTYAGDANLDGQVDAGDYGILDAFIQIPGATGYGNGDFNYDGFIDAGDYGTIDNSIQFQGPPFPTSGSTAGLTSVSAIPEPAACGFALFAALLARRRRRRR